MQGLKWHTPAAGQPVTGVALVMHGMNLRPAKMGAIAAHLTAAGVRVLVCSLRGHGDNFESNPGLSDVDARLEAIRTVTYARWRAEIAAAYAQLRAEAKAQGDAPMFLAGFSLGCLMGSVLFAADPAVHFDRMLFFAPALRIRRHAYLPGYLAYLPRLIIPSLAPRAYRANRGASVAAYGALYRALNDFSCHLNPRINVPTLIFCDPKDELISYSGLESLIVQAQLTHWTLCPVIKDAQIPRQYHHLIVDPASVGASRWAAMMEQATQHLVGVKP